MTELASNRAAQARIRELEAQLEREHVQFALAERAARVGYWRVDLPQFKITCSPGIYSVLGVPPSSADFMQATAPYLREFPELPSFKEKVETAIRTRSGFSYRTEIRCVDDVERVLEIFGEVEIGPDGDVHAIVGATHDVTEQVAAQLERDEFGGLYNVVSESVSDIIMVHDGQGIAEFASASLERLLGWTIEDVSSHNLIALIHPDDLTDVMELRHKLSLGEKNSTSYRMRSKDGRYIWLETSMSLVNDPRTGEVRHIISVMRDVNDRKEQDLALQAAVEAAEAANRSKSAFLANMSHELRTPLNAVIGFSEAMSAEMFGPLGNPRYHEYCELIQKSGQHLLDLVNDILDMAKIEAGKFKLAKEDINLSELVEECVQTMAGRAESEGVHLHAALPAQALTCTVDRRAVKQIALNLLSNAIKFTPAGGHVELFAAIRGDVIVLEFRDDGIGIADKDLQRLGKPFEQVCSDPNLAKKGTGLGLALVRALIAQHGGQFSIDSPGQDGTIVTVTLPRFACDQEDAAAATA